jgi:opacity protein-like surface antigen
VTVGGNVIPLTNANANQYIGVGGTVTTGATLTVPTGSSVTYVPGSYVPGSYTQETYTQSSYTQSSYSTTDSNQGLGWEAGVRVGRVFNNSSLLYGLVAYQGQQVSVTGGPSTTLDGIKVGAGLEIDLKDHWFFGSEVDWVWYGDWSQAQQNVKFTEDELRATARIGYRF